MNRYSNAIASSFLLIPPSCALLEDIGSVELVERIEMFEPAYTDIDMTQYA